MNNKTAIVIHSGGMDSSLCLALAQREFGSEKVGSLSFAYAQRHKSELQQAAHICRCWNIEHATIDLNVLAELTSNALTSHAIPIAQETGQRPNTLVIGRNGLMAQLGAIYAYERGACCMYMGVMESEGGNAGYRDCSSNYMALKQQLLRLDLGMPDFELRTPLIALDKYAAMELAHSLGLLTFLLQETISCYEGIPRQGCRRCPACHLRNEGLRRFAHCHPTITLPYDL